MSNTDIRYKQRFSNFQKALALLETAVEIIQNNETASAAERELQNEGLIKRFEYTFELSWNVMKDFLEYEGVVNIIGSRSAIREALKYGLIDDEMMWYKSIISRNETSHNYDKSKIEEISSLIIDSYLFMFEDFETKMTQYV